MTTADGKVFGPHSKRSKMTFEKVAELRRMRQESGTPYRTLGAIFGVDHKTARSIAIGKTWVCIPAMPVFRANEAELEQVKEMIARRIGVRKIAATLGVTERSVQLLMKKHGVKSSNSPIGKPQAKE